MLEKISRLLQFVFRNHVGIAKTINPIFLAQERIHRQPVVNYVKWLRKRYIQLIVFYLFWKKLHLPIPSSWDTAIKFMEEEWDNLKSRGIIPLSEKSLSELRRKVLPR